MVLLEIVFFWSWNLLKSLTYAIHFLIVFFQVMKFTKIVDICNSFLIPWFKSIQLINSERYFLNRFNLINASDWEGTLIGFDELMLL